MTDRPASKPLRRDHRGLPGRRDGALVLGVGGHPVARRRIDSRVSASGATSGVQADSSWDAWRARFSGSPIAWIPVASLPRPRVPALANALLLVVDPIDCRTALRIGVRPVSVRSA
jgi:hypothetical protein